MKLHPWLSTSLVIFASLLVGYLAVHPVLAQTTAQSTPPEICPEAKDIVIFDEMMNVTRIVGRNFNVWLQVEDAVEGRHQQEIASIRGTPSNRKYLGRVTLYRVVGVIDNAQVDELIRTPEQRDGFVLQFKWPPGDFRFRVVVSSDHRESITYVPGHWAYLSAKPRSLLRKTAFNPNEEIALRQLNPTVSGIASFEAPLLLLRDLVPGHRYRVQVIKIGNTPLPQGISLRVRVARPQIAK